ncbi:hypothetical protein LUZ60_011828 [Juncus effusus]|nr:hypothetical protein LUZ60_011828 [Juncus effusus]
MDSSALFYPSSSSIEFPSRKRIFDEELILKLESLTISKRKKLSDNISIILSNFPSQITLNQPNFIFKSQRRDWSSLPSDLLLCLVRLLDSMSDFASFRRVCKSWHDISAPSHYALASQPPLLLCTRFPDFSKAIFDISRQKFCKSFSYKSPSTLCYSHGFLISKSSLSSGFSLQNIFNGAQISLPNASEPFKRIRFSSSPISLNCTAVLIRPNESSLQFCQLGDSEWRIIAKQNIEETFDDLLFLNGKLYALMNTKNLVLIDLYSLKMKYLGDDDEINKSRNENDTNNNRWMLAECSGHLLRVMINNSQGLSAFRWDFKYDKWVEVLSLNGKSLFFSSGGFGGCISPNGNGIIRANCVYYIGYRNDRYYELSFSGRKTVHLFSKGSHSLAKGLSISNPPVWIFPSLC